MCRGRLTSTRACFANQFLAIVIGAATAISPAAGQTRDSLARTDSAPKRPDSTRAPLRLCAGGDVTLGTNLDTLWAKKAASMLRAEFRQSSAPDSLLAPLKPLFADADVILINVEGAIGTGYAARKCPKNALNCFAFRQPVSTARALRRLADTATVVGNVANNHARDAGDDGFATSLAHLTRAGVLITGADTLATPVVTRRGDTIAVLGFYTSSDSPDARDLDAVRRHVQRAVDRWGTVIVTVHLGAEGPTAQRTRDSTELFLGTIDRGNPVAFADAAFEGGATMVIGHGPHVLRAAEWRGDRLVLYSLGNLLTYGPFRLAEPMNRGAVACAARLSRHGCVDRSGRRIAAANCGRLDTDTAAFRGAATRRTATKRSYRSGVARNPMVGTASANIGTRATPRQILIFGAGARFSGLSMTRPATLLACTKWPSPT